MNVGQIYESLLGLAGFYKNEYFRIPPFDENYDFQFSRNLVYWQLNELNQKHYFFYPRAYDQKVGGVRDSVSSMKNLFSKYQGGQNSFPISHQMGRDSTHLMGSKSPEIAFPGRLSKINGPHNFGLSRVRILENSPRSSIGNPNKSNNKTNEVAKILKILAPGFKNKKIPVLSKGTKMGVKWSNVSKHVPIGSKIGLNPYFPGKMRLFDGQTGETFF